MKHSMLIGALVLTSLAVVPTGWVSAQTTLTVRAAGGLGGSGHGGMVQRRHLDRYAEILGFNQDQRESAQAIHEGYENAYRQARDDMRKEIDEVRRSAEDTGDQDVFMEKMPGINEGFRKKVEGLEKSLFSDLKALTSAEQESKWTAVERCRRREVGLRGGGLSGEAVDLTNVVRGLKLAKQQEELTLALEAYEMELDKALAEKAALVKTDPFAMRGGAMAFDLEAMQKSMEEQREVGRKIVDVNQRHARKLEGILPEESRPLFSEAVRKQTFPRVYRPSRVTRQIDAVDGFSDLDASQKEQVKSLREAYERDLKSVNDAWASAIADSEKKGESGEVGGAMISFGEESEPQALKDARKARRDLDDKTASRLKSVLKPEQQDRLAKVPTSGDGEEEGEAGGMRFMMSTERAVK